MISHTIRLAASVSLFAIAATAANAQAFNGTTGAAPVSAVVLGTSATATTGDSSVSPFTSTVTTVQQQNLNSTTAPVTTAVTPVVVGGNTYNGTVTVSGTGSQAQTVTGRRVDTFDGGLPPVLLTSVSTVDPAVNVGAATVSAVSASGFVGSAALANDYQATLSTAGPVTAGSVVATENATTVSATGTMYTQRVGTATYNPSTGNVTVALPTAATSSTSIGATGISTTGAITAATGNFTTVNAGVINANVGGVAGAAAINAGGGRITNVAAGTASTDAVNLGQMNTAIGVVSANLATQVTALNGSINNAIRRADAGTAVAVAMGGGYFLPGKKVALNVNYGNYRGESAIAGNIGFLVSDNFALNAGVATGFNDFGGTAFRVGGSVGF